MTIEPSAALVEDLLSAASISDDRLTRAFEAILSGAYSPCQTASLLTALRTRPLSTEVLLAGARAMREVMVPVRTPAGPVLDTCGTGGDGHATLNLSSAAALVIASCGITVAKHGNRSVSSRCGSADLFESLGIPLGLGAAAQEALLEEVGIAFLFAPAHHPAMKTVAPIRKELGFRTVFNALGPLSNPARATHQIVGIYEEALRDAYAGCLARLGVRRAWVVRGHDGLDEVSPTGPTQVTEVSGAGARTFSLEPEDFGLPRLNLGAISGGGVQENRDAVVAMLSGEAHPALPAIVLNAAAGLAVVTEEPIRDCANRARRALDSGEPRRLVERFRKRAEELA